MRRHFILVLAAMLAGCATTGGPQRAEGPDPTVATYEVPPPPPPPPPSAEAAWAEAEARERAAASSRSDDAARIAAERAARAAAAAKPVPKAASAAPRRHAIRNAVPRPAIDPKTGYARVRVFYGTDRAMAANAAKLPPAERYLGGRGRMGYGQAYVSIPRAHVAGELEAPSIFRFEFREDPSKHVVLLDTVAQAREPFLQALRTRVAASPGRNAFVFIHGYNVSFADAARRTAQLSYDLAFDGAPVFFSWPSQAKLAGYTVDEANIEWATSHIKTFLVDVAERSGADNLFVVGHSMGNRGLTRALATLMLERPDLRGRFREVILAAPDVDAEVFRNDLAPALVKAGRRVTLYASSKDLALKASKEVHGYPRAGDAGDGIVIVPGIDTIDASNVDDSILAHSYFVESIPVIRDIATMLRTRLGATKRPALQRVRDAAGVYWRLAQDR